MRLSFQVEDPHPHNCLLKAQKFVANFAGSNKKKSVDSLAWEIIHLKQFLSMSKAICC